MLLLYTIWWWGKYMSISRNSQGRTYQTHQKGEGDMCSFFKEKDREIENLTVLKTLPWWRHLNQISCCLCHKNLGLDSTMSDGASYKFIQLVDLQISLWVYTHRPYARRSMQGVKNDPHWFCQVTAVCLTLFRMGVFGADHGWRGGGGHKGSHF